MHHLKSENDKINNQRKMTDRGIDPLIRLIVTPTVDGLFSHKIEIDPFFERLLCT